MVTVRTPWAFQELVHELDRMTQTAEMVFGDRSVSSDSELLGLKVNEDSASLVVELPGVRPEDLAIELEDRRLTLRASRADLCQEEEEIAVRERSYGEFSKSYTLPWAVQEDQIEARFDAGILTVDVPRAPEPSPRRIPIKNS